MKDLIVSELRRFRRLALVAFACHAIGLVFLARLTDLLHLGWGDHAAMLLAYMLLGLVLALVQVGSYRAPSRWLWLVHRPLAPARIFAALATAAVVLLAGVVVLPLALTLVVLDLFSTQVVDVRHYASLLHVLAFASMAWFAGTHAATSRHRTAILVIVAPVLLAMHLASVAWLLLPVALCTAWLAYVARHGFRADRNAPIARGGVLLATALPLQLAFFVLVFHLGKASVDLGTALSERRAHETVVLSDETTPDAGGGSFAAEFVAKGLADSDDPRAASWRDQLPLLETAGLVTDVPRFPVRHQFGNVDAPWWDAERGIEWTFSHDAMRFLGRDPRTGEAKGAWGVGGAGDDAAYAQVPLVAMTPDTLYAIDGDTQRQTALLRLAPGESFIGRPVPALDRLLVVTDRRMTAWRTDPDAATRFAPRLLDWSVEIPDGAAHLVQVDVVALMDGWLVSFFHDPQHEYAGFERFVAPWQRVVHVNADGVATIVGERRGVLDHRVSWGSAPLVPASSWWVSPLLHLAARAPVALLDVGLTRPPVLHVRPDVPRFVAWALALAALSVVGAWAWLRGTGASRARRALWLATCALLSLPALLSLLSLEPRTPRR